MWGSGRRWAGPDSEILTSSCLMFAAVRFRRTLVLFGEVDPFAVSLGCAAASGHWGGFLVARSV